MKKKKKESGVEDPTRLWEEESSALRDRMLPLNQDHHDSEICKDKHYSILFHIKFQLLWLSLTAVFCFEVWPGLLDRVGDKTDQDSCKSTTCSGRPAGQPGRFLTAKNRFCAHGRILSSCTLCPSFGRALQTHQ